MALILCFASSGGGIGGLALAAAISSLEVDSAIQVDIYEAAAKMTQVGAGITLWPRGWEILKDLGMENDLAAYISPGQELPSQRTPSMCSFGLLINSALNNGFLSS